MIYLVMILIVSQIIHFIHFQIIMSSTKRRLKSIDFQIRNMSQWIVSNQHSLSHRLEQIHDQVNNLYVKVSMVDRNMTHGKSTEAEEPIPAFSIHMQAFNKESGEKFRKEDIQQYYAILLQELQQLDSKISQVAKEAIPESPLNNTQLFKNEINNRLNGNRLNKNNSR
jgi:putative lipase involved disintegration of autophagic bodies